MLKILIINPPRFEGKNVRRDERSADILENEVSPFYQGAVLAQYLRLHNKAKVKVLDANGLNISFQEVTRWVGEQKDAGLAIIKAADDTLLHDAKAVEICHDFGLATMLWEPVLSPAESKKILEVVNKKQAKVDYLILGEAELTVSDFLKVGDKAAGIAYFKDGKFTVNKRGEHERLASLEDLPIPDFNDLPVKNYRSWFNEVPWMTLFTSRGCPGNCNYCLIGGSTVFRGYGHKIRFMSAERIFEEVEILIKEFGVKHITFWDDCFTLDRQRIIDFCELVNTQRLNFKWSCMSRVDTIDEDLIKIMKQAGLTRIGFGIESGSQKILDSIPKKVTVKDNYQAMEIARKYKIWTWIYILVGLPEEDEASVNETIVFIKRTKPDYLFLGCVTPFPGTRNYETGKEQGLLKEDILNSIVDEKIITGAKAKVASKYLTVEQIEEAKYRIHKAFVFSSLKVLFSKIISNLHQLNFKYIKDKFNYFILRKYEDIDC